MNPVLRVVVAVLAGIVTFLVTGVGVTELYSPRIEFSLFVGLPVGIWAGIAAVLVTGVALWYRDAGGAGVAPAGVTHALWATVAVAVDVVVVFSAGTAWYFLAGGGPDALSLVIFGIPVTMPVAAAVGYLASRGRNGGGGPTIDGDDAGNSPQ